MSSTPKVLIVDDEERFRMTLRKLLAGRGIDAEASGSAEEALGKLAETPYDVVLLDVRMPGMNGIEALAEIKKLGRNLEVIVLTGHASVDVAMEIMRRGGYEYLLKPCPIEELIDKIDSAYERKTAREERLREAAANAKDRTS